MLLDGLGRHHQTVTTASREAQAYFDQGLRLVYAFNHIEAERAFREATRLDPACAMCYWGIALTHGSNYNSPTDAEREKAAFTAIQQAVRPGRSGHAAGAGHHRGAREAARVTPTRAPSGRRWTVRTPTRCATCRSASPTISTPPRSSPTRS